MELRKLGHDFMTSWCEVPNDAVILRIHLNYARIALYCGRTGDGRYGEHFL